MLRIGLPSKFEDAGAVHPLTDQTSLTVGLTSESRLENTLELGI